ncbi:triphosphoribosyl-dephospho-CoA synthase CitG [Enterobacter hormaechei]
MSEIMLYKREETTSIDMDAEDIVALVSRALLTEVHLTPKPGLVDIRNSGAHRDMDLVTFEKSIAAIAPWMEKFYLMGFNTSRMEAQTVMTMLRPVGLACEAAMFEATAGVNTHRGAIFALGLLSAASGRLQGLGLALEQQRLCDQVAQFCRGLVVMELARSASEAPSKSEQLFMRYGLSGARGEAENGFVTVRTQALPVFNRVLAEHHDMQLALLQTLLHLMAWNDDTNLVSRGGLEGLYYVQNQAQKLLWQGGVLSPGGMDAMQQFDDELIARHLSPGGSADLLAVTWFLSHFPAGTLVTS